MKTKKLTEAAMLSALFVIVSIIAIYTGLAYGIYLDIIVPIFIALIYLRLGSRYTVLSSIASLLIVMFSIGDVVSAIWMSQGILIGFIRGYFIPKENTIFDDFFYSTALGCLIMILIDIYFSKLTGYSFIEDFKSYSSFFQVSEGLFQVMLYIFIATIPLGTVLVVYFGSLMMGKKLNILNKFAKEKYKLIKNYRKVGTYLCCSENTFKLALLYLVIVEILNYCNLIVGPVYVVTVIMSVRVVAIYFVVKDSFSFVIQWINMKFGYGGLTQILWLVLLYLLVVNFKITTIVLIFSSVILNLNLHIREKQITILNKFLSVNNGNS